MFALSGNLFLSQSSTVNHMWIIVDFCGTEPACPLWGNIWAVAYTTVLL